jgi:hypothetical protein
MVSAPEAKCMFTITDLAGHTVHTTRMASKDERVNTSMFLRGMYLYCVMSKNTVIARGKLLLE